MAERAKRIKRYIKLIVAAGQTVHETYRFGREQKLPLLIATATHQLGRQFLAQHLNILFYQEADKVQQDKAYQIELFSQNQNYSIIAYGHFLNLNMFQNAHEALTTAYEINQLCIHLTGTPVGEKSPSELITIIRQIEENIDLNSFQSMIDKLLKS